MDNMRIEKMRKNINAYFNGRLAPIVLMLVGLITTIIFIGWILIIIGLIWYVVDKNSSNKACEEEFDELMHMEMVRIHNRAYEKLNITEEQVDIIDPICLYGPAKDIDHDKINNIIKFLWLLVNFINFIFSLFITLFNRITKNQDLTVKVKIGKDNRWRYSYNQYTVFVFDKNQLYIYYANVDITTGIIHSEGTYEYYYADIVGVATNQVKVKKYLPKKWNKLTRPYTYNIFEDVQIYTGGCSHTASVHSDIDHTLIDKQFKAMRNLIREKKKDAGQIRTNI